MHRIAPRPLRVRPTTTFMLVAGLTLFGAAVTAKSVLAEKVEAGHALTTQDESANFAAEFDRRFRDGDQTGASAERARLEHRPYDPYYDAEDENGSDHAGGAQTGSDDAQDHQATSGQQSAEHERDDRDAGREGSGAADDSRARQSTDRAGDASRERGPARACNERTGRRIGRMLDRMERLTRPAGEQQQAFEKLRDAANKALEMVRAACPTERPITPGGRLAAAEKRLEILLEAIRTVRPALDDFYKTLSEEQKAHFYAASPARHGERWREHTRRSLGDGRLDAWRDEMRRRWRDRWSDDNGMRPRDGGSHDRMFRDDRHRGYSEGRRNDGEHEWRRSERRDDRRSHSRDNDDEDSIDSWNL